MTRIEFLEDLGRLLENLPRDTREDILYDYEEHFRNGLEEGKSEEAIAQALGEPKAIARHYRANYALERAETKATTGNLLRAVIASVGLGFFNLVFVLGPFIGLVSILMGLFAAALGITVAGMGTLLGILLYPYLPFTVSVAAIPGINKVVIMFTSVGATAFGLLFLIGNCYLARFFYRLTLSYLKFNLNIIRK